MKAVALNNERVTLEEAIRHYGAKMQVNVAIEEMSELTKELCKSLRGNENAINIAEEIADVTIMLEQLKIIFNISPTMIEETKEYKLHRLENRMFEEKRSKENGCK